MIPPDGVMVCRGPAVLAQSEALRNAWARSARIRLSSLLQ
jgi:hypothetical protein